MLTVNDLASFLFADLNKLAGLKVNLDRMTQRPPSPRLPLLARRTTARIRELEVCPPPCVEMACWGTDDDDDTEAS